jgi:hypothetical protein
MPVKPSQSRQVVFTTQVLPDLFHHSPEEFINLLASKGNDFLKFYWDIAAKNAIPETNPSLFGLNYDIRTFLKETTICLITLPKPAEEREAYFVALIYRPYRRTPFLGISDTTKVIALDLDSTQTNGTFLREWDKHLLPDRLGAGPAPRLEDFYQTVCQLIRSESR